MLTQSFLCNPRERERERAEMIEVLGQLKEKLFFFVPSLHSKKTKSFFSGALLIFGVELPFFFLISSKDIK